MPNRRSLPRAEPLEVRALLSTTVILADIDTPMTQLPTASCALPLVHRPLPGLHPPLPGVPRQPGGHPGIEPSRARAHRARGGAGLADKGHVESLKPKRVQAAAR
jgi:hypothetical protein